MSEEQIRDDGDLQILAKYFVHGILFSGMFLVTVFVWAFIFVLLVIGGAFIGLILGLIALFYIMGEINAFLADLIWDIPVTTDWKSLLLHGFALFCVLTIAQIPSFLVNFIMPSLAATIVLFIVYCFIDGFIAKKLSEIA